MILNTGSRTDIPAFYSAWFLNRVKEGYVLCRNPYRQDELIRYSLSPEVVDVISFCTKNPAPMLPRLGELGQYRMFWGVTITPYGKDLEPNVPPWREAAGSVRELSKALGKDAVCWRYDPVLIHGRYSLGFHKEAFEALCEELSGFVSFSVVSFIDLYRKTLRNFPEAREVSAEEQAELVSAFVRIGRKHSISIRLCSENPELGKLGADVSGCMTREVLEKAGGIRLSVPRTLSKARPSCSCLLGSDIGAYDSCVHGCRYCYANSDPALARENFRRHDPESPLLIGWPGKGDRIREARQVSYISQQLELF